MTILLVEDSVEDVFLFKRALKKTAMDLQFSVAENGRAAIDILRSLHPDIVFLDLKLPMVSGFEVLQWIQEQAFDPPIRVVVLSGSPHEADKARALELGATDYIVKPISPETLGTYLSPRPETRSA